MSYFKVSHGSDEPSRQTPTKYLERGNLHLSLLFVAYNDPLNSLDSVICSQQLLQWKTDLLL
jgi:hypothetical protein